MVLLPTTSDPFLGAGKWGAGPTFVIVKQSGGWTALLLVNHVWSFAGDDFTGGATREDVSATLLQPVVSYTTQGAVTLSVGLEASANWNADEHWTAPLHIGVSKLTRFASLPMSVGVSAGPFTAAPGGSPDWRLRFTSTLLLPR